MAKLQFSPEALADLRQTQQYITQELCNAPAAKRTIAKLLGDIRQLERFPEMGSPLSAIINFDTDYRFLVSGNYISFYRYADEVIYIVRVLYARRNFLHILFGESHADESLD